MPGEESSNKKDGQVNYFFNQENKRRFGFKGKINLKQVVIFTLNQDEEEKVSLDDDEYYVLGDISRCFQRFSTFILDQ